MARFSDEERAAILERSLELLTHDVRGQEITSSPEPTHEEILQQALAQPVETTNERHRRELTEKAERRAMERDKRRDNEAQFVRRAAAMDAATQAGWENWLRTRLDAEREAERDRWREIIPEVLATERKETDAKLDRLRAGLELKIDALRAELAKQRAVEDGLVIDLPPLSLRKPDAAA